MLGKVEEYKKDRCLSTLFYQGFLQLSTYLGFHSQYHLDLKTKYRKSVYHLRVPSDRGTPFFKSVIKLENDNNRIALL